MAAERTPETENAALRTLRVLEAVGRPGGPHPLGRLAAETGLAKPTVHRILRTLGTAGYVAPDGAGAYGPGPRVYALSAVFTADRPTHTDAILSQFQSEVDHTVHIALRSGNRAIYVRKIDGEGPYQMASRVGGQLELHCTAIGKAVLAHSAPEDVKAVVDAGLSRRTAGTITDPAAFADELEQVRSRGYAVDDEENESTIRCLAAPLLDRSGRAVGGISISTITFHVPREQLLAHAPRLLDTAALLAPAYL